MNVAKYTRVPWACLVFVGCLAYFLLSGAWVPYPGASADFLAAICFPGQLEGDVLEPLGTALTWLAHTLGGWAGVTFLSAALGAWTVTMLFVAAVNGVRHACADFDELRDDERPRAWLDGAATALLAGFGVVAAAVTSLPLWALGTRPLPAAAAVAVGATAIALAMSLRRRCAEDYAEGLPPSLRRRCAMGALFALAAFLFADSPAALPVSVAAVVLGGGILVRMGVEGRLSYLPWIVLGLAAGLAAAVAVTPLWCLALGVPLEGNAFLFWANRVSALTAPALMGLVMGFEGSAPLALFALAFVLLLGCFPRAFFRFASPLIGQLAILALAGCCLARWPAALWETMAEPTPLAALGVALVTLDVGLLVGSWIRNWLDVHVGWPAPAAHAAANVGAALLLGGLACAQLVLNYADGAGRPARAALDKAWAPLEARLPLTLTAWLDPEPGLAPLFLERLAQGTPLWPVSDFAAAVPHLRVGGKPLAEARRTDPGLDAAAALGPAPLRRWLLATDADGAFRVGPLPPAAAADAAGIAERLGKTRYGRTPAGQRTVRSLRALAARLLAARALDAPAAEAADLLRQAIALDPANDGLRLSLGALEGAPGVTLTQAEHWAAVSVAEGRPWLRHPTAAQAQAFERAFGPVRTEAFASARRLADLRTDARAAALRAILRRYRDDPAPLNEQERLIALTLLDKDEAAALLSAREAPSEAELEFFLCAWPWSPEAEALYAKHAARLAGNPCLAALYGKRAQDVRQWQAGQVSAFFMRDGRYAYALFHLKRLLAEGRIQQALDFVGGFNAEQALAEAPLLLETLRLRALSHLAQGDPEAARRQAHVWLIADPDQPDLWAFLLGLTRDPEALDAATRDCLARFPGHPLALRLHANALRPALGDEAARRWLTTLLPEERPHADR